MSAVDLDHALRSASVIYADDSSVEHSGYYSCLSSFGAVEVASAFPASVACTGSTTGVASLSLMLDSGASSCFFRDCTDLTPLRTPVSIALADSTAGQMVARSTTTLPCPAAPSGFLTCYYTPSFSRNLVGVSHLHDLGVVTTFPLCAAPHSSSFPPSTAPLQTLHLDVWGPSLVLGPRQERYFLIVVDDYSHYTKVFTLRWKDDVPTVLEPWLLARGGAQGLCGLRLHSDRGGEFSSTRLETFCQGRGIIQSYTLPDSPQQNGVAERRIGLVMEAPPGVVADFRVWGSQAHVPAPSANKLSPRTHTCIFLGFPLDTSGWVFYDTVTYKFFTSQNVTFNESVCSYRSRPHRGVSHVTLQSSPPQHLVPVVSGGGVGVEVTPVEDTAASSKRPRPVSPPGFPSVPQFPPHSSLRPVATEHGGVPAGGTGGPGGVGGGGVGSRGAGARGTSTVAPTPHTSRQERVEESWPHQERLEEESRPQQERVAQESRSQQWVQLQPQQERAEEEPQEWQHGQVPLRQMPEETERQRLRLRDLPDPAPARLVRGPLPSPPVPPVQSLSSSQWTRRSPLSRAMSPEPRRSHYRAGGPFHLVLCSRILPPPVLPQPHESSLTVLHDPLSNYLRASRPVVSRVLSTLVTHTTAPLSSVSALVTTVTGFASSHRLDYAAHLVSGPARSLSSGGAPVFPLEVLEDRQFELGFLAAVVPHLCDMLLAPEGDSDALDIPIPRTHAEAVSGPWALYWIAVKEAEMALHRSTGTYVDAVPPPGTNVVSGMWLYKVKRQPGSPAVFKGRYVARGFSQREGARRKWHDTLHTTLAALDFFPSSADLSLFVRRGSTPFFVLVYVDNLVFATPDRHALASVKEELQRRHTCTDLGELQRYLGMHITRDRAARTITLTQSHMVEQILTRFCFPSSKVLLTPLGVDHGLTVPPSDEPFESSGPYPELVGCLMYVMTCTRPDLVYPHSVLAQFIAPGRHRPSHWYAAKRVAKYVASTSGMGLVLGGKQPVTLTGFSDSSWADEAESPWSTQGYCFSLGIGAVSWRSTLASSVSSSSCETEVYAAAMAA
ncbi:unnamed protein product [Closterium sp. NIES-53]